MSAMHHIARSSKELVFPLTGPAIWAAHLFALYATETILCADQAWSPPVGQITLIQGTLSVFAVAALGIFMSQQIQLHRGVQHTASATANFLREISIALAAMAMIAVTWSTLPAMLLPACRPA